MSLHTDLDFLESSRNPDGSLDSLYKLTEKGEEYVSAGFHQRFYGAFTVIAGIFSVAAVVIGVVSLILR
jgi:hypothetical protein